MRTQIEEKPGVKRTQEKSLAKRLLARIRIQKEIKAMVLTALRLAECKRLCLVLGVLG